MKLVSVNAGLPRDIVWRGKAVRTSIFKSPVAGRVRVEKHNVQGDQQSDLSAHGGTNMAVYAYPSEHFAWWRKELPALDFTLGAFGENLTTQGLTEETVHIGDRFRVGSAEFMVTQPRTPCFKLGIRFDRPDMVKRFLHSGRSGFYLAVLKEGELAAGDAIVRMAQDEQRISVADIVRLFVDESADVELMRRASELPALSESWRNDFRDRLPPP